MLSILFRNPNFLILDEPTNDLDLPTLSVLEEFLLDFPGCLMIVSHDRYFMDRLVDHLFVFEGDGDIRDFPGNYANYRLSLLSGDSGRKMVDVEQSFKSGPVPSKNASEPTETETRRLSYKEKRELELLGKEIPSLQQEKLKLTEQMSSGELSYDDLAKITNQFTELTRSLEEKEWRWLELSEIRG